MKALRFLLAAAAALAVAACSDRTPTGARQAPDTPRMHLGLPHLTCVGTQTATFTPGLLLTPRTVSTKLSSVFSPCVSPDDPTLTSGTLSLTFTTSQSCLDLPYAASGTKTYHWNNGQSSSFTFNAVAQNLGGQFVVVSTGTITAGQFAGSPAVEQITGPTAELLDCLAPPGLTSRFNTVVLEIL
jgi:hypothetical protein